MKMNKIVLASLLSVSLLGASTSVFAAATTNATFNIEGGTKSVTSATDNITFDKINIATLLGATGGSLQAKSDKAVAVTVNDTTADNKGWTLDAKYSGMHIGDAAPALGESLTIGTKSLAAGETQPVYTAAPAEVMAALNKDEQGNVTKTFAQKDVFLTVPNDKAAVGNYTATIDWTLASDTNASTSGN